MRLRILVAGCLAMCICTSAISAQVIKVRPKPTERDASAPSRPATAFPAIQPSPPEGSPLKTVIEIDILTIGLQGDPNAQRWGKVFEDLGTSVRIRDGRDVDASVTEKIRGSLRYVTASGVLNRDGDLTFGQNTFQLDETTKLKEWLDEIKTYGAQGAPEGKPLWGLNRDQFNTVIQRMTQLLTVSTPNQSLTGLVTALRDHEPPLPIRLNTAAQSWLKDSTHDQKITVDVTGFTTGTGLAIALNEIGAGMRPVRTPTGQIEYEILPLELFKDPWPIGWEPKAETPRNLITPELFKMGVVGFDNAALSDVLAAIQSESKTPIVIDSRRSLAKKIDVKTITVSYPAKKTAWAIVVSQCVRQAGLYNSYRQDEGGRGFVLVAPFEPKAASRD